MRTSKITYGSTTLTFALPARSWMPRTAGVGAGVEWSAAGVPASWATRRARTLEIVQRVTEGEWPQVRAWIEHAQEGGTFVWFPDASDSTSHTCYLVGPAIDEEVKPTPTDFGGVWEITFTIRRTDGAAIDEPFYDDE